MKNSSLVTIIAAFVSIGTAFITPAKATESTKVDYKGKFDVQILPFLNLSREVNTSVTVDNFSGRLSDAGDAELTIDNPFSSLSPDFIKITALMGSGSISNNQGFLSSFNFNYNKSSDVLTIKDYNFANIEVCLSSTCNLKGNGRFSATLINFFPVSGNLNFNVDQTATPIPDTQALSVTSQSVPEPSLLLGFIGLGGLFAAKRRQQKAV